MKNKILGMLAMFLLTSCGVNTDSYIYVDYQETPRIVDITIDGFSQLLEEEQSAVVYVTFVGLTDCGCSNSESVITNYLSEHHFNFQRILLNQLDDDFVSEYNRLVEITRHDDPTFALPDLIEREDGSFAVPVYPRMMFLSLGYIAFNTDKDFAKNLDKYIRPTVV